MDFRASLDAASIQEIVRLQGFSALLNPEITSALTQAGTLFVNAARDNTYQVFDNPTGALADSIYFYLDDPNTASVAVGVIYGRRRELGFVGLVDSLGRVGTDRARPYLQPAVDEHQQEVEQLFAIAANKALGRTTL